MNRYLKLISKLKTSERKHLLRVCKRIIDSDLNEVSTKKLKKFKNYYRVRVGRLRVVFEKGDSKNTIINIDYRKSIYERLKKR